jgi:3D (Asp-Asp-Asp) domain-containing protein
MAEDKFPNLIPLALWHEYCFIFCRMTKDKVIKIFLIFMMGWFLGYLHHYYAEYYSSMYAAGKERGAIGAHVTGEEAGAATGLDARGPHDKTAGLSHEINRISVKTTAYSNDPISINVPRWRDGLTATGVVARHGTIAADWSVFPPGTVLYVPGYGWARVEDRGAYVRGHHLDLYMDTRDEALQWGVKDLEVIVVEMGQFQKTAMLSVDGPPRQAAD